MPVRIRFAVTLALAGFLTVLAFALQRGFGIAAFLWSAIGLVVLDVFWPRFDLAGETFSRGSRKAKRIAITFDDGPDPRFTPAVLDILRRFGATATFFILGRHAQAHPELVRRIVEEGHEIGSHGFGHVKYIRLRPSDIDGDLRAWERALDGLAQTGKPLWLRPPHGLKHFLVRRIARRMGYRLAAWTRGVWDTDSPGADVIARRATAGVRNGEVILFHDGDGSGRGGDRSQTVQALGSILGTLKGRGFEFVTFSDVQAGAGPRVPWGKLLLGTAITLGLAAYVVRHFDVSEIALHLSVRAPWFLVASLALDLACLFLKSQGWREFVLPLSPIRRSRAFLIYLVGAMLNNVLPMRGGDLGRADLLGRKEEVRRLHGLSTIALEGVVNGVSLLPILLVAVFALPLPGGLRVLLRSFVLLVLAALAVGLLIARRSDHRWLHGLKGFKDPGILLRAFLANLLAWLCYLTSLICMLRACSVGVSPWAAPVVALSLGASMFIPSAPGRLGAFEAAIVLALAFFSVGREQALGFALVLHAAQTLPAILWGSLAWLRIESKVKSRGSRAKVSAL